MEAIRPTAIVSPTAGRRTPTPLDHRNAVLRAEEAAKARKAAERRAEEVLLAADRLLSREREAARRLAKDPLYLAGWDIDLENPADNIGRVFYLGEVEGSDPDELGRQVTERWGKWFGPGIDLKITKLLGLVTKGPLVVAGMAEVEIVASNSVPRAVLIDSLSVKNVTGDGQWEIQTKAIERANAFFGPTVHMEVAERPELRHISQMGAFHDLSFVDPAGLGEFYANFVEIRIDRQEFVPDEELIRAYEKMRRVSFETSVSARR